MATYDVSQEISFTDINGDTARTSITFFGVADTSTLAGLASTIATTAAALQACSNAKVTQQSVSVLFSKAQISAATAPPPSSAVFPSVTDGARLQFASSAGFRRFVQIPAPLLSDFKVNSNIVNPNDANISALIALIVAQGVPPDVTNLYEGGAKTGRRLRRRVAHKSL